MSRSLSFTLTLCVTGHGASTNFYSYANFLTAAASFPSFATSSDATTNKRELAAFLAHISHETGGLCWIKEGACVSNHHGDHIQLAGLCLTLYGVHVQISEAPVFVGVSC
jgi:hypothetical protein